MPYKAFLQLPVGGLRPDGILVVLFQGREALQNSFTYKRIRRTLAAAGHAVLGVNFRGSEVYMDDQRFIAEIGHSVVQQVLREQADPQAFSHQSDWLIRPPAGFTTNRLAAAELAREWPDQTFDYGSLQALDVLIAMDAVRERLGRVPPTYAISISSGAQVALTCLRLAPRCFHGLLALAPFYLAAGNRETFRTLITDPFMGDDPIHRRGLRFPCPELKTSFTLMRKVPVPFPAGRTPGLASIDDELDLRDQVRQPGWPADLPAGFRLDAITGSNDLMMPLAPQQALHQAFADAKVTCTMDIIGEDRADGRCFSSTGHKLWDDMVALTDQVMGPWLRTRAGEGASAADPELGTAAIRRLPSANGEWIMRYLPRPHLTFEPRR